MNFKITYFKLINHIVLGDKECHVDNDIVSIMGRNGSGKSFLIDTLHPYSRSSRFVGSYPIKKGEVGYKQINFTLPNGVTYETIHEYVPKGKSHACKSYLNKMENGIKYELNPTGHCEKYDELIRIHLNADSSILNIGFISFKANGITGSKGVERKKVLETTIDSKTLKDYKKNVRQHLSDHNAYAKQYEHKKIKIASFYTEESLNRERDVLESKKSVMEIKLKEADSKYHEVKHKLDEVTKMRNLDINKIRLLYQISGMLEESDTIHSKHTELSQALSRFKTLSNELYDVNEQITSITTLNALKKQMRESESHLNVINNDILAHTNNVNEYVSNYNDIKLDEWMWKFENYSKEVSSRLSSIKVVLNNTDTLNEILRQLSEEQNVLTQFIAKYDLANSNSDGEVYDITYHDVCNSCSLYNKFIKSEQFILENTDKYKKTTQFDLPEITDKIHNLSVVRDTMFKSVVNIIDDIKTHLTQKSIDTIKVNDINSFISACSNGDLPTKINKLYVWVKEKKDIIERLNQNKTDLENKISSMKFQIDGFDSTESELADLADKRSELTAKCTELDRLLNIQVNKMILDLDMTDRDIIEYSLKNHNDLKVIYNMVSENDRYYNQLSEELQSITNSKTELPEKINNLFVEIINNTNKLSELQDVNTKLLEYDKTRKILQRCKDVIEKDIPLALLQNNLKFIEDSTNSMLSANDINMNVSIISTDSEILIEVTLGDKVVDDATQLSDGETCIMSLLLNACILHIIGYPILCLDEIDANLDTVMKTKFNDLVYTIMSTLNVSQVICISHNVSSGINFATKLLLGSSNGLDVVQNDSTVVKL